MDETESALDTSLIRRDDEQPVATYAARPAANTLPGIACVGFGRQWIATRLSGRVLDCHAAVWVDEGRGWLDTPTSGRLRVEAPALFYLYPGLAHSYGPDEGTAWHEHWALFEGEMAVRLIAAGLLDPRRPLVQPAAADAVTALFSRVHADMADGHPQGGMLAGTALHRLIMLASGSQAAPPATPDGERLRALVSALRQRALAPLDLSALAREFGFAPATLRRHMHDHYRQSPMEMLQQCRLDRARELLATTSASIEEIAGAAGFADPYYFSRLFRHHEGMPPTAFRRRHHRA